MKAEVIAIGDELTSGRRLDTNSQWLSQRLAELGIRVLYHSTVGDDLPANVQVFQHAFERADIVISTGGLGPTADDLTREAIAEATGTELVRDDRAWEHIRSLFARRKREMPHRNIVQAMFPAGSKMIDNPHGTAPGIEMEITRTARSPSRVFALPGVPAEMREMWQQSLEPAIYNLLGDSRKVIRHREIKCFGVGESDLEQMLPDLIRRGRQPSVGITVHQATITLRITAEGADEQSCFEAIEPTARTIRDCLGELIFGEGEDELHDVVIRLLADRGQTLATAECNAGGLLASWLNEADTAGSVFRGGVVLRDQDIALGMFGETQSRTREGREFGEAEVAAAAGYVRSACKADFGLAIGPFPAAESSTKPAGQVHYALVTPQGIQSRAANFGGHPHLLKARTAKQALNLLRRHLVSEES